MDTKSLFFKLLSAPSVTPEDAGLLEFIKDYLPSFKAKWINVNGVKNLFLIRTFAKGPHLCFAGHVDIVPAGEGWDSDPFTPRVEGEYIYARGTQDMKSGVCAFIQACKNCEHFNGTLSILLTSDEEGDAKFGTLEVLKVLKEENNLPDFAIVAEPTCESTFGDALKVGRRGSINATIKIKGLQGHVAYPQKTINPIHQLAPLLSKIAGHRFDDGDEFFEPSQLVITDIRSGYEVTNLTPDSLKLMFNVRNSTKTDTMVIENYINEVFKDLDFSLDISQSAKPFITDSNSKIVKNLESAIKSVSKLSPKLSTAGGTSDARFFSQFGVESVEFGVLNDTIHAANERCKMSEVLDLEKIFSKLIKEF